MMSENNESRGRIKTCLSILDITKYECNHLFSLMRFLQCVFVAIVQNNDKARSVFKCLHSGQLFLHSVYILYAFSMKTMNLFDRISVDRADDRRKFMRLQLSHYLLTSAQIS